MSDTPTDDVLVRISPEVLESIDPEGVAVIVIGLEPSADGTYDMVLRSTPATVLTSDTIVCCEGRLASPSCDTCGPVTLAELLDSYSGGEDRNAG